jgi:hypothetical protein
MTTVEIRKSTIPKKKYMAIIKSSDRKKTIYFGASGMSDYTIHHDIDRRERYRNRHKNDNINDIYSPGFWSWHLLWGDSTDIRKCIRDIEKKYNLNITMSH